MNLSQQQNETSLHAVDYWQVVKNRYGIILLTLLLVFMTASVITYVMPKKYESSATIEVKPRERLIDPIPGVSNSTPAMTAQFFGTEFEKIKSRRSLSRVVETLDLANRWGISKEGCLQTLKGIVSTQNIRGTDMISIRVRHTDKEDARDIAAEVANAYKDYRSELEGKVLAKAINEMRKTVNAQRDKVEESRKVLSTISLTKGLAYYGDIFFQQGSGGLDENSQAKFALDKYTELESEKLALESQIDSLTKYDAEELLVYAAGLDLPDNIIKTLYPDYLRMKREMDGFKASGLGDKHPTVVSTREVFDSMKQQLDEGVLNLRTRLQGNLDIIRDQLARFEVKKDETKQDAIERSIDTQDYVDAKREFETNLELLEALNLKLVGAQIDEDVIQDSIIVHDEPIVSESPVSPNVTLNLVLGAVVGLVFGVGIAFFLEYLDTSVKSLEDVERYLQVPVLAVIPKDVGVLHKQNGMSPDAEAYRILRTNIEFNRKNPEDNAITVVSGGAGEGKSTTLVNLAYICAQGGYTTLMIDGDLRRPRLHTFFDFNNSVGLTNYLTTELMLEDVILQTPVDNLYFMPSGILPVDAAGILNSRRMSELIQDVKQRFDLVLVDSPPILGVSDASVLASEVDLTMIVVQHRKLPRNMLLRVKEAVENVGGQIIGVVLNNVDVRSDSQYQYYTSYYTYYAPAESQIGPSIAATSANARQNSANSAAGSKETDLY